MGRLGMELGLTARVLQPRILGRMVEPLSSTTYRVSPATDCMVEPAGISRKLGLSAAALSAAKSAEQAGTWASGKSARRAQACAASIKTRDTESTGETKSDEARHAGSTVESPTASAPCKAGS